MAIYNASAILTAPVAGTTLVGNTATISNFNPSSDILNFDNNASMLGVSANRIGYNWGGSTLNLSYAGKTITLNMSAYYTSAGLNPASQSILLVTPTNITFWNGTQFQVGDQTFGPANDTNSNLIFNGTDVYYSGQDSIAPNAGDTFASFGTSPTMNGGKGDDVFNLHQPSNPSSVLQTVQINGGAGFDRVQLQDPFISVTSGANNINLRNQVINWGQTTINLSSIESVRGTTMNDNFFGGQTDFVWMDLDSMNAVPGTFGADLQIFAPNIGFDNIYAGGTGDGTRMIVDYSFSTSGPLARISMAAPQGDQAFENGNDNGNSFRQVTKYNGNGTVQIGDSIVGADNLNDVTRILGTNGNDLLQGGSGAKSIFGALQEEFQGNGGADTINGYGGFDLVFYGNAGNAVHVNLANGHGWDGSNANGNADSLPGGSVMDTLISIEGVVGGNFNDTIIGNDAGNYLQGSAGSDFLSGGEGYDTASYQASSGPVLASLAGGSANDNYVLSNGTQVFGTDTLVNIEELRGTDFNDTLIGGSSSSTYLSPGGHPVEGFEGRAGNDLIVGANFDQDLTEGGNFRTNWAKYQRSAGAVSIDLSQATGQDSVTGAGGTLLVDDGYGGTDTLVNINGLEGSRFDDVLVGDNFRNALRGDGGNDILDGGGGIDTVTYSNSPNGDGIFLDLELGFAYDGWGYFNSAANNGMGEYIDDGFDELINIENVQASNFDDIIRGDANANVMWGLDGHDVLDSRDAGADTLYGGGGDDQYWVKTGDIVSELQNDGVTDAGGHDQVLALTNFTAPNFVEDVWLRASANYFATGNTLNNKLRGNAGNNKLTGGAGNDTIQGGLGNDTIIGGSSVDWVSYDDVAAAVTVNLGQTTAQDTGGAGIDWILGAGNATENLEGSRFGDRLTGSDLANIVKGGNGNDTISGGLGLDSLEGGLGRNTFLFDTAPSATNVDTIADFRTGTDKIALDATIFTAFSGGTVLSGNFKTGGSPLNATTDSQFLIYQQTGSGAGKLYYDADANGAGAKVQIAAFTLASGVGPTLSAANFVVTNAT